MEGTSGAIRSRDKLKRALRGKADALRQTQ